MTDLGVHDGPKRALSFYNIARSLFNEVPSHDYLKNPRHRWLGGIVFLSERFWTEEGVALLRQYYKYWNRALLSVLALFGVFGLLKLGWLSP